MIIGCNTNLTNAPLLIGADFEHLWMLPRLADNRLQRDRPLLQLLILQIDLPFHNHIPQLALPLNPLHCALEPLVYLVPLRFNAAEPLLQRILLTPKLRDLTLHKLKPRRGVLQAELVLRPVLQPVAKLLNFDERLAQRRFEVAIFVPELDEMAVVLLVLLPQLHELLLVLLNRFQVVPRDVIIVVLHLLERTFMVRNQLVDVLVLPLLDLVRLYLAPQLQVRLEAHDLLTVPLVQVLQVVLKSRAQRVNHFLCLGTNLLYVFHL